MKRQDVRRKSSTRKKLSYWVGSVDEVRLLKTEFKYAITRSAEERMRRGLIHTYKPIVDDAPYRIFPTMRSYTQWCERRLPQWLGYGKVR